MLCAKIVQAENKAKFIWDLLRRRLCSEKIVQPECKAKFIWDLLRRSLCSEKIVQPECKAKFIWDLLRHSLCLSLYAMRSRRVQGSVLDEVYVESEHDTQGCGDADEGGQLQVGFSFL